MDDRNPGSALVAHSTPIWLPRTMTWLHNQVRALNDLGIRNIVLAQRLANKEEFPGVTIYSLSERSKLEQLWNLGLRRLHVRPYLTLHSRLVRQEGAAILHSHFGDNGWANQAIAGKARVPHVVSFYGYDVNYVPKQHPRWGSRYRDLFATVDRVLCEGPFMSDRLVDLGCPRQKVIVHHFGIDLDTIRFNPRVWQTGDPLRVLVVGTFREKKGIPFAIRALDAVNNLDVELTIVGDTTDDDRSRQEERRINAALAGSRVGERTRLLGFVSQRRLREEAAQHHLLLAPSVTASDGDTEGGAPVVLMEMIASGMPVVATMHCDIPYVLGDSYRRFLAEERDVAGLTEILRKVTDDWPSALVAVYESRQRMETHFHFRKRATALLDIYREVLASTAQASRD